LRQHQGLICILVIDEEGLPIAEVGQTPASEFALYSPMVMETTRRMSLSGGFGEPICNGIILTGGRILITHQASVKEKVIYLSLLCGKVPPRVLRLLNAITALVAKHL
jgi:hypothetical protein